MMSGLWSRLRAPSTTGDVERKKRLTPADWKGFAIGDYVRIEAQSYLSYVGMGTITGLTEHCGEPAVWIVDDKGQGQGVVDLSRVSLQARYAAAQEQRA